MRKNDFITQACPYCENGKVKSYRKGLCGDWCPLFGEPRQLSHTLNGDTYGIKICHNELVFDEFVDERK